MGFESPMSSVENPYAEIDSLLEGETKEIHEGEVTYKFFREEGQLFGMSLHDSGKAEGVGPSAWSDAEPVQNVAEYIKKEAM
jgi:hypothetical protein